jgi:hypothetical protein
MHVRLHDFYEEAEAYHVVMEYVQGPELFIKLINKVCGASVALFVCLSASVFGLFADICLCGMHARVCGFWRARRALRSRIPMTLTH